MLKTALIFQDNMVLQRDKKIAIWGTAEEGALVKVYIQEKTMETFADQEGKWKVICGPLHTSFCEKMVIVSQNEQITFQGVQVGEVWLAGGQSNMEFHMRYDADIDEEKKNCHNDNIRFFDYPEVSYVEQINEANFFENYGYWCKADCDQLERFSAVAYYFAKDLQQKYEVPIGIIGCNWGGSPAVAWMSESAIQKGGGQIYIDEYKEAIKGLDLQKYEELFKYNPEYWRTDLLANPISDLLMFGATPKELQNKLAEMGIAMAETDIDTFQPLVGPKYERRPSGLYESMLKPLVPYGIRGVIWYQGETDGDCHPEVYQTLFQALICNWRELWQEQLPFLFVQIAGLERWMDCCGKNYVQIRDAQKYVADNMPNTGMAVVTDVGMKYDIHPKKKQPVGHRLALLAERKVYGDNVLCDAPELYTFYVEEGKIILEFRHAGEGLYIAEKAPYGQVIGKEKLGGLQIFQNGSELNDEKLKVIAQSDTVIIYGEEIKTDADIEIRIAQTGWYLVNLYNSAGIPAMPVTLKR